MLSGRDGRVGNASNRSSRPTSPSAIGAFDPEPEKAGISRIARWKRIHHTLHQRQRTSGRAPDPLQPRRAGETGRLQYLRLRLGLQRHLRRRHPTLIDWEAAVIAPPSRGQARQRSARQTGPVIRVERRRQRPCKRVAGGVRRAFDLTEVVEQPEREQPPRPQPRHPPPPAPHRLPPAPRAGSEPLRQTVLPPQAGVPDRRSAPRDRSQTTRAQRTRSARSPNPSPPPPRSAPGSPPAARHSRDRPPICVRASSAAPNSPASTGRVRIACNPGLPAAAASARLSSSCTASPVAPSSRPATRSAARSCFNRSRSGIGASGMRTSAAARSPPAPSGWRTIVAARQQQPRVRLRLRKGQQHSADRHAILRRHHHRRLGIGRRRGLENALQVVHDQQDRAGVERPGQPALQCLGQARRIGLHRLAPGRPLRQPLRRRQRPQNLVEDRQRVVAFKDQHRPMAASG